MEFDLDLRSRQQVRNCVTGAKIAAQKLANFSQEQLDTICAAISQAGIAHAQELGRMASEETGFGKPEDKLVKNRFAAERVWEAIRPLKTIGVLKEHPEEKVIDIGTPVGVIAGIVPSTNPTSSVIYKTLISIKSGNTIVFSPHPNAVNCTVRAVEIVAEAAEKAGCPAGAISCIRTPTMDAINELMKHDDVSLILATGGGAMVHAAYSSGTPAIGVGAGNGPAYIHKSADIAKAVRRILDSKTFDNGTVCASEQSIIVEADLALPVTAELQKQGAYFLSECEAKTLSKFILRANGTMNPAIVGKSAQHIAQLAGLKNVPSSACVLIARESEVGDKFPYSREKLCPILAFYVEKTEEAVLEKCCKILYHEGAGHTFMIHAEDEAAIRRFAARVPVSRILVNTPGALGGVGATTNLFPALTLGCGAVGGSSSSNNIGPLDLINIRRIAWGVRDKQELAGYTNSAAPAAIGLSEEFLEALTEKILKKLI